MAAYNLGSSYAVKVRMYFDVPLGPMGGVPYEAKSSSKYLKALGESS